MKYIVLIMYCTLMSLINMHLISNNETVTYIFGFVAGCFSVGLMRWFDINK